MKEKKKEAVYFRPLESAATRLGYAEAIGIAPAQMINDLITNYGQKYLEDMKKKIQQKMLQPVP